MRKNIADKRIINIFYKFSFFALHSVDKAYIREYNLIATKKVAILKSGKFGRIFNFSRSSGKIFINGGGV